jgi:hypothetical protein
MEKQMNLKRAFIILIAAMLLLPGLALAQSTTVRFAVEKTFTDSFPGSIEVTLSCNTGLPLTQSRPVSEGDSVVFVVEEVLLSDFVECVITEDGEDGYNAIYNANDVELEDDLSIVGCFYDAGGVLDNLDPELNTCEIINHPDEVPVIITKDWVIEGAGGDSFNTVSRVLVQSEGDIDGGELCGELEHNLGNGVDYNCRLLTFVGPGEQIVLVTPSWDGTAVYIDEILVDSAIESENGCGGMVEIFPTEGAACAITNTVFFEGIPTLNQYGLAILAVLMLGVGFVGFRRFV